MAEKLTLGITVKADTKDAEQSLNRLNSTVDKTGRSVKNAAAQWEALGKAGRKQLDAIETARRLTEGMSQASQKAAAASKGSIQQLIGSFNAMSTASKAAGAVIGIGITRQLKEMAFASIDAKRELERFSLALKAIQGSSVKSAESWRAIEKAANELGISLQAAAEGYTMLAAATKGTVLEGQEAEKIFMSFARASAALGKSAADTQGILLAVTQMISKGKVSMEELRGQLGERLPVAMKAASDAMGVTVQELDKMVSSGSVAAEDLLPKMAKELDKTFGRTKFDGINANMERLNTEWTRMKAMFMDSSMVTGATKLLTFILEKLNAIGQAATDARESMGKLLQATGKDAQDINLDNLTGTTDLASRMVTDFSKAAQSAWGLKDKLMPVVEQITAISQAEGFDTAFLLSLAKAESSFNRLAVSGKGAKGIFQFMPGTAKQYGLNDPFNVEESTKAAIRYLKDLLKEFHGSQKLAMAGYNAGEHNVHKYGDQVPPFAETQGYVTQIQRDQKDLIAAMGKSTEDITKEVRKSEQEAYKAFEDRINKSIDLYEIHTQQIVAQNKTMLEQIKAQEEAAGLQQQDAIKSGNATALEAANKQLRGLAEERKRITLETLAVEEAATKKELAGIEKKIIAAKKLNDYAEADQLQVDRAKTSSRLKELAEERKRIEISTGADILEADKQFAQQRQDIFKQTLDAQTSIGAASMDAYVQNQIAALDSVLNEAKAAAAESEALRKGEEDKLTGTARIAKERENLNERVRESLDLVQKEYEIESLKLDLAKQYLDYQIQITQAKLAAATGATEKSELEAQLINLNGQLDLATTKLNGLKTAADQASSKVKIDASVDLGSLNTREVKESQLEMNAFWDQYMGRLQDYASLWQEITGQTNDGWSSMMLAAGEYAKQVSQIDQFWQSSQQQAAWGEQGAAWMGALEQGQAAAAMMAKTMLAAREHTEEGSQAYDNLTIAAENFMQLLNLLNIAEGISAILNQYKGDPYTAAFRAAAVAMQVASMGISTGFSGSSSKGLSMNRSGDSGGVFGGQPDEVSQSISNSLELISDNSTADLSYSAEMVASLHNIEMALGGVTNQIIRNVGPTVQGKLGTIATGNDVFAFGMKGFDPLADAIFSLVFNVSRKITAYGIQSFDQTLNSILNQGFQGLTFTDIETTTKVFGLTVSKKLETIYAELDNSVESQITKVFIGITQSLVKGAEAFGVVGDMVINAIGNMNLNLGRIDLMNLTSDEIQKKIEEEFSKMSDNMAARLNKRLNLGLKEFIQVGEGMYETLIRVANAVNVATGVLGQIGFEPIDYKQLSASQKQAKDISGEIAKATIIAFEGINTQMGQLVDVMVGSAQDIGSAYEDLVAIRETASFLSLNFNDVTQAMIAASGGIKALLTNLQEFQKAFRPGTALGSELMTLQAQYDRIFKNFGAKNPQLTEVMPNTREAFAALVESIDTSSKSGQRLYAALLSLSSAFDSIFTQMESASDLMKKYLPTNALDDYRDQLRQVGDDFKTIIDSVLATLPGGAEFVSLTSRRKDNLASYESLLPQREEKWNEIDKVNNRILELESMKKLTKEEKKELKEKRILRDQLTAEYKQMTKALQRYVDDIADIDKKLEKNPGSQQLIDKRKELVEAQGDAIIKTISDIWDQMTQAIQSAKQTLMSIQDSLFELTFASGSYDTKVGMAGAKRISAESAYGAYTGNDINKLNQLASDYYNAIMEEYNTKLEAINFQKDALEKERDARQKAHDEEISALEKQLGTAKDLNDALESIQKFSLGLKLGSQSTLSPERQLAEARKQYEDILARAQSGDTKAISGLGDSASSYLEIAQKYFGSSAAYADIFNGVENALTGLGAMQPEDVTSIQDEIDRLNKEHEVYLKSIDDQIAALHIEDQIKELQTETAARLQSLQDDLGPRITEAEKQAAKDMQTLIDEVMATNVFNERQLTALEEIAKMMGVNLPEYTGGGGDSGGGSTTPAPTGDFKEYDGPLAYKNWNQFWKSQKNIWKKKFKKEMTWAEYKAQEYDMLKAQGMHPTLPNFARGGYAGAGLALVGEQGPEIVNFESPARVLTAEQTRHALSGSPESIRALEEIKAEIAALVRTQAGANPAIIAELRELRGKMHQMERTTRLKPEKAKA